MEIIEAILPLLLLLIVTVTGLIYWFSKDFSSRVELLVQKFRRAETGDLSVGEEIGGSDEIAVLDQQFNRMLKKLDQLIKTSYVQELENKEAQLKNLRGCEAHFSVIISEGDAKLYKRLGINVSCEAKYEVKSLYHK